ncbi:type II toxin-antitoxin system VapB family antitoxin [Devosia rhizoryzae]|uniref:Type II toxin-antitoxin system VapB family antitoxin n=1 Tax=Devosia rhizoryzae TaxID=2774137 RepID=A0ABX7C7W3_9HYPH|nr:type II toxin-antitoxin system VapB family antitoxin [Devosia rhizoryzae]QQR39359.1 type II toxin-antitoxin system VapB family antitoxin [Devosia rhizoryzae]
MAFYVRDESTDRAVRRLAQLKNKSLTETIREAVESEYARQRHVVPLSERLAPVVQHYQSFPARAEGADKAFFDDLSGDA